MEPGSDEQEADVDDNLENDDVVEVDDRTWRGGDALVSTFSADAITWVEPTATLREVTRTLAEVEVGAALISSPGGEPAGIITERDVVHALAAGHDPDVITAAEAGSSSLVWCDAEATVEEVAVLMMERYVRHVLVGQPHDLRGIVSARDLLGAYCEE